MEIDVASNFVFKMSGEWGKIKNEKDEWQKKHDEVVEKFEFVQLNAYKTRDTNVELHEWDQAKASLAKEKEKNRILAAENVRASARIEHLRKSRARAKKRKLRLEGDVSRTRKEMVALQKEVQTAQNSLAGLEEYWMAVQENEAKWHEKMIEEMEEDHLRELTQHKAYTQFLGKHLLLAGCKISHMVRSWEECDDNLSDALAEIGEGVGMAKELKKQVEGVIGAVFPTGPYGQKLADCLQNVLDCLNVFIKKRDKEIVIVY
ncbi:hypothetical protein COLO4_36856 [Corchorus olitorius]|uniref:Uncharacterized protein n=1 Tax=Corchorus olitorius TaxID=93759 RepID=A0A1R3G4T0_9ROSI|nr:hypothetical protein COLO4_36856 [Corchorus olitorius]